MKDAVWVMLGWIPGGEARLCWEDLKTALMVKVKTSSPRVYM